MDPHSLDALGQNVDSLIGEAGTLSAELIADASASALRIKLARHIIPLGVKDSPGLTAEHARRLAALSRQRVRLLREGHVLAQRIAELNQHANHLSRLREDNASASAASAGKHSVDAIAHLHAAKARRDAVLAWADEQSSHRRQVIDWAARVVQHQREIAPRGE